MRRKKYFAPKKNKASQQTLRIGIKQNQKQAKKAPKQIYHRSCSLHQSKQTSLPEISSVEGRADLPIKNRSL
jgi:hypothetical protein